MIDIIIVHANVSPFSKHIFSKIELLQNILYAQRHALL